MEVRRDWRTGRTRGDRGRRSADRTARGGGWGGQGGGPAGRPTYAGGREDRTARDRMAPGDERRVRRWDRMAPADERRVRRRSGVSHGARGGRGCRTARAAGVGSGAEAGRDRREVEDRADEGEDQPAVRGFLWGAEDGTSSRPPEVSASGQRSTGARSDEGSGRRPPEEVEDRADDGEDHAAVTSDEREPAFVPLAPVLP